MKLFSICWWICLFGLFLIMGISGFGQVTRHYSLNQLGFDSAMAIEKIRFTDNGKLWIGTTNIGDGISEMSETGPKNYRFYTLPPNTYYPLQDITYCDSDSSYWLFPTTAYFKPQIFRFKRGIWNLLTKDSLKGLDSNLTLNSYGWMEHAFQNRDRGKVYFSNREGRVFELDPHKMRVIKVFTMPTNYGSFYQSRQNNFRIISGMQNVMVLHQDTTFNVVPNEVWKTTQRYIDKIHSNDDKHFWFRSNSGSLVDPVRLCYFNGDSILNMSDVIENANFFNYADVALEKSGKVWWCDYNGMYSYHPKKGYREFLRFNFPDLTGAGQILIDSNNTKWINEYDLGLGMLKDVKTKIVTSDTLPDACGQPNIQLTQTTTTIGDGIRLFKWTLGDGRVLMGDTIHIGYSNPGVYKVVLAAIDSNSSVSYDTIFLRVQQGGKVTITTNADSISTCRLPISLTANGSGNFEFFRWYGTDNAVISSSSTAFANKFGLYRVEAATRQNFDGCKENDSVWVVPKTSVGPAIRLLLPGNQLVENLDSFSLFYDPPITLQVALENAFGNNENLSYSLEINSIIQPKRIKNLYSYTIDQRGKYIFKAFAYNADSCLLQSSLELKIRPFEFEIPNLVLSAGKSANQTFLIKGLSEYRDAGNKTSLQIFNRWGKEVYKTDDYQNNWPDPGALKSGVYFFQLNLGAERQFSGTITYINP